VSTRLPNNFLGLPRELVGVGKYMQGLSPSVVVGESSKDSTSEHEEMSLPVEQLLQIVSERPMRLFLSRTLTGFQDRGTEPERL
jgi:hypothetical protein